jgi:hypothetical protein
VKEEKKCRRESAELYGVFAFEWECFIALRIQKFGMTSAVAGFAFFSGTKIYYPALF